MKSRLTKMNRTLWQPSNNRTSTLEKNESDKVRYAGTAGLILLTRLLSLQAMAEVLHLKRPIR
jgi:hypothetical protein